MVKMLKNNRKVEKTEEGKYVFTLIQQQEYEKETVENMLKSWREREEEYKNWLSNYEKTKREATKQLHLELQNQREKIKKDLPKKQLIRFWN